MNHRRNLPVATHTQGDPFGQGRSRRPNAKGWSDSVQAFNCSLCGAPAPGCPRLGAECSQCGSVSVINLPSAAQLSSYYQAYADSYTGGGDSGGTNLLRYARRYQQLVHAHSPRQGGLRLLDVGSSTSPFPNLMGQAHFRVSVLDYVGPPQLGLTWRFLARYGIGVVEMLLGAAVRWALPTVWRRWRDTRTQRFKGISWLAFARPAARGSTARTASTPA